MGKSYGRRAIFTPESEVGMIIIDSIAEILNSHSALSAWQIRRTASRSNQLYLIGHDTESKRSVETDRFTINVFVEREIEGKKVMGESECLYIPGEDLKTKIEQSAAMAALVVNEPFTLPEAGQEYEQPETVDPEIKERPGDVISRIKDDIFSAVDSEKGLCLSAAEIYASHQEITLLNSRGLRVEREETEIYVEFVLLAGRDGCEDVEAGTACRSRFYNNLRIGDTIKDYAGYACDSLTAKLPPTGKFDVVFSGEALDTLFNWFTVQAGGVASYQRWSKFEEGIPVVENPEGERLTLISNPLLAGGMRTRSFDVQGLPLKRLEVVKDGIFQSRTASKRYADYLGIPPVGDFANVEVAPGVMPKDEIFQGGPILHLCRFSTFEPNGITGAFSGEIRSGWLIDKGKRTPVKGGAVTGTIQEAFKRAYFSKEIVQREAYKGPAYVKLCGLDIGGE